MNPSTPGLPVHHQLLELTQTHVHWVGNAIQPSPLCRPLLLPSVFTSIRVYFRYYDLLIIYIFIFSCAGLLLQCGLFSSCSVLRLSCSKACGIFLDQGSTSCLLLWQADSLPRKPYSYYWFFFFFFFPMLEAFTLDCCVSNKLTCRIFLFKTNIHLRNTFWATETLPDSLEKPYGTWKYIDLQFSRNIQAGDEAWN